MSVIRFDRGRSIGAPTGTVRFGGARGLLPNGRVPAYNLKASNTANLRAALNAVRAGSADTVIALSDDSTGRGRSEANGLDFERNWFNVALRKAQADGLFNTTWSNLFGTGNITNADNRWNNVGTTTNPAGIGGSLWQIDATGEGMNFAPGVNANTFDIWHFDNNSMAFDANLDGGSNTRVDGTTGTRAARLTGTLAEHTVNVAWAASTVRLIGIDAFDSTRKQAKGWNFSVSGGRAVDAITTSQQYASGSLATTLAPNMSAVIIGYSINERQQNNTPADYKTNVQTLIDLFKAGNANIDIILKTPVPSGSTGLTYAQSEYVTAIYELAATNDCPVIQVYEAMGSYASGNALGWYVDTLHLSQSGNLFVGEQVMVPVLERVLALAA